MLFFGIHLSLTSDYFPTGFRRCNWYAILSRCSFLTVPVHCNLLYHPRKFLDLEYNKIFSDTNIHYIIYFQMPVIYNHIIKQFFQLRRTVDKDEFKYL
jgi:hypothetical protein